MVSGVPWLAFLPLETVPLDHSGKPFALGFARHFDPMADLKLAHIQDLADLELALFAAKFAQDAMPAHTGLVQMALLRLGQLALWHFVECELQSRVSIVLFGPHLYHRAGPSRDDASPA